MSHPCVPCDPDLSYIYKVQGVRTTPSHLIFITGRSKVEGARSKLYTETEWAMYQEGCLTPVVRGLPSITADLRGSDTSRRDSVYGDETTCAPLNFYQSPWSRLLRVESRVTGCWPPGFNPLVAGSNLDRGHLSDKKFRFKCFFLAFDHFQGRYILSLSCNKEIYMLY